MYCKASGARTGSISGLAPISQSDTGIGEPYHEHRESLAAADTPEATVREKVLGGFG